MARYAVHYLRSQYSRKLGGIGCAKLLPLVQSHLWEGTGLDKTHAFIGYVDASDLEAAWTKLNHWIPDAEQRAVIASEDGPWHTSMSIGDILVEDDGTVHVADSFGFETLEAKAEAFIPYQPMG